MLRHASHCERGCYNKTHFKDYLEGPSDYVKSNFRLITTLVVSLNKQC